MELQDDYSRRLCAGLAAWRYEDLPTEVVRAVKHCLIDSFGVTAGAADAPGIAELNRVLGRWESGGRATGLIGHRRYSPPTAAMANGAAAHALDFDDQNDPARVHTACVLLPALLATAEGAGNVSGREFLLAYALGAEMHSRFGLACYNSLGKGWHPTMVFGGLAAALACARLLRLDDERMLNALGIAFHQACGSAQSMRDGVLTKRLGAGFAARAAVTAAFLAAEGITGTRRPLEGSAGLFALFERGEARPQVLTDRLGSHWHTLQYSFKPYPCCRCSHSAIELGIGLHGRVKPEEVRSIEIGMGRVNWEAVGPPYEPARDSVVHAQFSVAYCFARALADGRVDLRSFTRPSITDPAVGKLAARIKPVIDAAIPADSLERVRVTVELADSRSIELRKDTVKGSPGDPMSEEELYAKFRRCVEFGTGAGAAHADALIDAVLSLDAAPDAAAAIVGKFPRR